MALIIEMKLDCDLCVYQVFNIFSWSQPSKLISIFIFFFNDKTLQQAAEGRVNVLKYTFGNSVNLVSVLQKSLSDCYPASCVDPCLLLCSSSEIKYMAPPPYLCVVHFIFKIYT